MRQIVALGNFRVWFRLSSPAGGLKPKWVPIQGRLLRRCEQPCLDGEELSSTR
jgi:hypothetical protein